MPERRVVRVYGAWVGIGIVKRTTVREAIEEERAGRRRAVTCRGVDRRRPGMHAS
jgi:hypothetical protein